MTITQGAWGAPTQSAHCLIKIKEPIHVNKPRLKVFGVDCGFRVSWFALLPDPGHLSEHRIGNDDTTGGCLGGGICTRSSAAIWPPFEGLLDCGGLTDYLLAAFHMMP